MEGMIGEILYRFELDQPPTEITHEAASAASKSVWPQIEAGTQGSFELHDGRIAYFTIHRVYEP